MELEKGEQNRFRSFEEFLDTNPDIFTFSKELFDWEPFEYQKKVLEDDVRRLLMVWGRQSGKSTICAIKGLYKAITTKDTTVLIVSPTQRQSSNLFRRMKKLINTIYHKHSSFITRDRYGKPYFPYIVRETQTCLEFANGSEVISLPAGEDGTNLLGYTAHMIILDECALIKPEVFIVLKPMFATTWKTCQFILISTPRGVQNYFYEAFSKKELGFKVYSAKSIQSPLITKEFLKIEREGMTENEFQQEYEGRFIDESDTFFTLREIEDVMDPKAPTKTEHDKKFEYYFGYDPALLGEDEAVGVILERRPGYLIEAGAREFAVVNIVSKKKSSIEEQIGLIKHLHDKWHFKRIVVDRTGFGEEFIIQLGQQIDFPVEGVHFNVKTIEDIYSNAKKFFESRALIMPPHIKMKKQLNQLKYEYRKHDGRLNVFNPKKRAKTDYPTALVLALWGTRKREHTIIIGKAKSLTGE